MRHRGLPSSWAQDISCVLIDARAVDGRLFAFEIRGRLNKSSLLLQVGLRDLQGFEIYVHGRAIDPQVWHLFLSGDTIQILPEDAPVGPPVALEDMLRSPSNWTLPCPNFDGPHNLAFLVLSDGGVHIIPIDPETVRSSADFLRSRHRASWGPRPSASPPARPSLVLRIFVSKVKSVRPRWLPLNGSPKYQSPPEGMPPNSIYCSSIVDVCFGILLGCLRHTAALMCRKLWRPFSTQLLTVFS